MLSITNVIDKSASLLIGSIVAKCAQSFTYKGRHTKKTTHPHEHTPLTLKVKTIIFLLSVFPSVSFSQTRVNDDSVFASFFTVPTTESESVFVHSQFINCVGLATMKPVINCIILGWGGRGCHRKTRKSVCECENSTFLTFHGLSSFPYLHFHSMSLDYVCQLHLPF